MPKLTSDYPHQMRIRVSEEDVEQLQSTAQGLGITVSELVRQSFRETIADVTIPEPPTKVPPIPTDSDWIPREIQALVDGGSVSREELERIAAREWTNLREEAQVFDGFDRLPDHGQSAYREHDALRAWVRALGSVEAVPDARERQKWLDAGWKHWRRAMDERRAEYPQLGLRFGDRLPEEGPRRASKPVRLALSSPPLSSEPRQRTKSRPRAKRTSGRRSRAPTTGDDPSPSDLAGPVGEEQAPE